jgi:hypothetical protein
VEPVQVRWCEGFHQLGLITNHRLGFQAILPIYWSYISLQLPTRPNFLNVVLLRQHDLPDSRSNVQFTHLSLLKGYGNCH